MKITTGSVLCAGLYSASVFSQTPLTIEQRFMVLEQRLQDAENRAYSAEAEIAALKQASARKDENNTNSAKQTDVPKLTLNKDADLKFHGDVEFNLDGASRTGSLTSAKTSANKNWAPGDKERWDINGRILLSIDGIQRSSNDQFAGFTVQPLADMNGKMNLDDAAFFFGQQQDWLVKVGRFEAYDMFPLNQDTFIEYSGNTANDLYSDGYGYIYMMKEARGRSNSGGNLLFSKTSDNWYLEVNTLVEDGSSLYVDQRYHGTELDNQKMWFTSARLLPGVQATILWRLLWKLTLSTTLTAIKILTESGTINRSAQDMV